MKKRDLIWHNERRKVRELVPFDHNPRTLSEDERADLEASIVRFNLAEIPAVNTDNTIIAGHQRLKILTDLGRGEEEIDVRVPNRALSLQEVEEYNVRSNLNTGSWDFDLLEEHFDVKDLLEWGFTKDELKDFDISLTDELQEAEVDVDRAEELQGKWKTERGQLWKIGKHRLLCADSTLAESIRLLLNGKPVDMVFTDPPYNVHYGASKIPGHKIREIENDFQSPKEWEAFVKRMGEIIKNTCKGDCYIWGASGPDGMRMRLWLIEMGLHWSATIIWKKQQLVLSPAKYQRMYEPCLYGWFGEKSSFAGDRTQVEVWEVDRPMSSPEHPTMKPVKLAQMALGNSSGVGMSVLDLFLGSGSTMVAAEQMGRTCYGVELEPKYVAVTLERLSKLGVDITLMKR